MTRNPIRRSGLVLLSLLLPLSPLFAEDEKDLRELLRDALYTEEVARDPEAAAKQYEALLSQHESQRAFAASALFRLAEVRRKQDRKDDAIVLYQRLLREFPGAVTEAKLAAENLAALGAKVPEAGDLLSDEESQELLRLKALEKTGPDLLRDPKTLENAVKKGWPRVVELLLTAGNDPYRSQAFVSACSLGYLEICSLMLEKCGNPPDHVASDAMASALHLERIEIVKFLLQKGFDPNGAMLLGVSVRGYAGNWDKATTEFILKAGADINWMPTETSEPFANDENRWHWPYGTPLHDALSWQNVEAANFLLDHGCKADLPTADKGITPLHIALRLEEKGSIDLIRRLLAAGADPNRRTVKKPAQAAQGQPVVRPPTDSNWGDLSPLEIAIRFPDPERMKLLLEAGAKPEWPETWRLALGNGDGTIFAGLLEASQQPPAKELLGLAVKLGKVDAVRRLLDKGASPHDPALLDSATKDRHLAVVELLIEKGMMPDETWVRTQLQGNWDEIKPLLFRRFLIPGLLEKPAVHFFTRYTGWNSSKELATKVGNGPPPSLPELLLADENLSWPSSALPGDQRGASRVTLWRKDPQGRPAPISFRLDGSEPFPELQWGDVIELDFDPGNANHALQIRNVEFRAAPTPDIGWALQRRISFPVTLEIDGARKELTLRGDRLIHDPTSDEVPWCTAGTLATLRWNRGWNFDNKRLDMFITITRKEWPEIRLPYPSDEASRFRLNPGDQMKLETSAKAREEIDAQRKTQIGVTAPGLPYGWTTPCTRGLSPEGLDSYPLPLIPGIQPTLFQLIAETQALPPDWSELAELSPEWIPASLRLFYQKQTILPHPDWSRIRIRRLKGDGSEDIIEVNMTRWMEEADTNASPDEIKKHDLSLQAGDIIELQVHEDRPGQPWKGLPAKEEAFLAKALQGRIQIVDPDSQMRLEEIRYKAPVFVETPAGWIPVPTKSSVQSARASALVSSADSIEVTRHGETFRRVSPYLLFLKDGDQIKLQKQSPQQPRPRIVPSPR